MRAALAIYRATYREAYRHPAYHILTLAAAALIFLSRTFTLFEFHSEANMIREMGVSTIVLWGAVACILMSHQMLYAERENRTALTVLAKPVPRWAYVVGKYFGLLRVLATGVAFLGLVLIGTLWTHEGSRKLVRVQQRASETLVHLDPPADDSELASAEGPAAAAGGTAAAPALRAFYVSPDAVVWNALRRDFLARDVWPVTAAALLAFAQIAVLAACSAALAMFAPPVVVATGTLSVYLVGHLLDYIAPSLERLGGLLAIPARLALGILPNLENFNPSDHIARGEAVSLIYVVLALGYAISYASAVLLTTAFVFSRREMP